MNRSRAALLIALALPLAGWSQTEAPAAKLDDSVTTALVRLGGQLMLAGKTYEYDRVLADDIGPRLTGSGNYVKASDWAAAEFTRMGLHNVHRESWEITDAWEPETWATGRILVPHEQRLHIESDGWSVSTPPGGVRGKVFYLNSLTPEAVTAQAAQIKGAIVLVDRSSLLAGGHLLIGKLLDTVAMIAKDGAQALILGIGATNDVSSMAGLACCNGTVSSLPVGNLGSEDTLLLRRLLARGPVEVEFSFANHVRSHVKVDNVVAEIPGTDPGGEFVLIGAHLDSWQLGTGAEDNGTGAASVLSIAQAVMASGVKPRRTMRFVLFGGEEEGLLGSLHYAREHAAEMAKCAGDFVTDSGSEPPEGWYTFGSHEEQQALAPVEPLLASLGAGGMSNEGTHTFSTDEAPFLVQGVPSYVLWTQVEKYMQLHHKPSDTFDKVNQRDLDLGATVVGVTALAFADAPEMLKHPSTAEIESELKAIQAFDEYQDMQAHHEF